MALTILNPTFLDDGGGQFQDWTQSITGAWEPAYLPLDNHHGAFVTTMGSSAPLGDHYVSQNFVFNDYASPELHSITIECSDFVSGAPGAEIMVYFGTNLVGTIDAVGTFTFVDYATGPNSVAFSNFKLVASNDLSATIDHVEGNDFVVVSEPELWTPAYCPIEFEISSINFTRCNFRYVADIYVNGTYRTTLKLFPNLSETAVFEVNTIIQDYLSYDLNTKLKGFNEAPNSYCNYEVKFGEEFDLTPTCNGTITQYQDLATSGVKYAWNGTLDMKEWAGYTGTKFVLNTADFDTRFLTNQPYSVSIGAGDYSQLMYIQDIDSETSPVNYFATQLYISTFDVQGNPVGDYSINNTLASDYNKVMTVGVGFQNLMDSYIAGDVNIEGGSLAFLADPSVAYYEVRLNDSFGSTKTKLMRYKIDRGLRIDARRFAFLGELGNMDSFTFTKTAALTNSIQRGEFTKLNRDFNFQDRGRTNITVDVTNKYTSNSGWLTVKEAKWIAELYNSVEVYTLDIMPYFTYSSVLGIKGQSVLFMDCFKEDEQAYFDEQYPDIIVLDSLAGIVEGISSGYNGNLLDTNIPADTLECGAVYLSSVDCYFNPIIVTSTSYEEKVKRTTKNIQYKIEYQPANNKQIQRN